MKPREIAEWLFDCSCSVFIIIILVVCVYLVYLEFLT